MKVRLLENDEVHNLKKGTVKNVDDAVGRELISKGHAILVRETEKAIDQNAHDALNEARFRDEPKE
jgi:hypothetical protein